MNIPPPVALQKHSWGGLTPEIAAEFEKILSGHGEPQALSPNVDPLPAQTFSRPDADDGPMEIRAVENPWQSKEQSVAEIKGLAERLQKFCVGGARTRIVREELHKLGIVELPYRMKKRKGWKKRRKATST